HFLDRQHGGVDVRGDGLRVKFFGAWKSPESKGISQERRFLLGKDIFQGYLFRARLFLTKQVHY
ncbi:MAG TPA: hypothetical protein DDW68_08250, partial [Verrucomicrobiales bacterium]|nr:hypothetical protein [Verrucomicrobiales bacterium]